MKTKTTLAALLLAVCCGCSPEVTVNNWAKVEEGMRSQDVELILGPPQKSTELKHPFTPDENVLLWDYSDEGEAFYGVSFFKSRKSDLWFVGKIKKPSSSKEI